MIGAGINGAAIAREAALTGARVLMVERDDIGCGTSAASTRLIHGGLRYLEYGEFGLVRESLAERERLLRDAPHLVRPLRLILPLYAGHGRPKWQIRAGMWLYDLLSFDRSLPGHRLLSAADVRALLPALQNDGLRGAATYFDAQVAFPERLVLELALDAAAAGAEIVTHAPVTRLDIADGAIRGVEYERDGQRRRASATAVVNAAGPWVDRVLGRTDDSRLIGGTTGAHLVTAPFPGAPAEAVYAEAQSDGRPFFVIPWNGLYLIGTTDLRFEGDPADVRATAAECRYLATETERLFSMSKPLATYVRYVQAGIRPLPFRPDGKTSAITRRHIVHRHRDVEGLYSIVGGKLTTHRALAEDTLSRLRRRLQLRGRRPTRQRPLPGALEAGDKADLLARLASTLGAAQASRLWQIYGGRADVLLTSLSRDADFSMAVAPGARVLVAELVFAVQTEFAVTLVDLLARRTMAALDADRALGLAPAAADWLVRLGHWDSARAAAELEAFRRYARRHEPVR